MKIRLNLQRFAGVVSGTSGNDTLNNGTATNVIIYGYGGNDSIYSNNGT